MSGQDRSRRSVLKKVAGTTALGSVALTGQASADTYVCEGEKTCPDDAGDCVCWTECKCTSLGFYERECCACDCDGRNSCSSWEYIRSYCAT